MATGPNRIDPTPVRMTTDPTQPRVTPKTDFGDRVKDGLATTGNAIATGAGVAASYVPGGAILSAAVSGAGTFANAGSSGQAPAGAHVGSYYMSGVSGVGGSVPVPTALPGGTPPVTPVGYTPPTVAPGVPTTGGFDPSSFLNQQAASNMQFLMLQQQMNMENQQFTTLSNVMKTRQDTVSNTIRNMAV